MPIIINCDMGEGYGLYRIGKDEELMKFIDVANVACGFHASDPTIMHQTVLLAKENGVRVGAHPGLPDLQGFGRRTMDIQPEEITDIILYQVGALKAFLGAEGMSLNHVKPHGALYGMAARDEAVAQAICEAAAHFDVPLYGMANTLHEEVYTACGVPFVAEYYADLDYDEEGRLIITREHEAVDPRTAAERVTLAIKEGKVRTIAGTTFPMKVDAVCVHSDTPGAETVARAVRDAVRAATPTG